MRETAALIMFNVSLITWWRLGTEVNWERKIATLRLSHEVKKSWRTSESILSSVALILLSFSPFFRMQLSTFMNFSTCLSMPNYRVLGGFDR